MQSGHTRKAFGNRAASRSGSRALAGGLILASISGSSQAATLLVPSEEYPTLQAAVDASADGDEIQLASGTYEEQVVLIDRELTLRGAEGATLQAPYLMEGGILAVQGGILNVHNLILDGQSWGSGEHLAGIEISDGFLTLDGVEVRNLRPLNAPTAQTGHGVYAAPLPGDETSILVAVSNSSFESYQKNGIYGKGAQTSVQVVQSTFDGGGASSVMARNGVALSGVSQGLISDSLFVDHVYTGSNYSAAGVYAGATASLQVSNSSFDNNQTHIYQVDVTRSDLQNNEILGGEGSIYGIITFQTVPNISGAIVANELRDLEAGVYVGGVAQTLKIMRNVARCAPIVDTTSSAVIRLNREFCPRR